MKKLMLVILLMQAFTVRAAEVAQWTVMVYIAGDNNLEDYVVKDIEQELALSGSTAAVQIVALADRGPGYDASRGDWQSTKLFHVTTGMLATADNAVADWGERNMGDAATLVDFVMWTKQNYPAHHYALYLWGHGWNTHPGFTMSDDSAGGDAIDPNEFRAALPPIGAIDVVAFDGCNMSSIEVAAIWRPYANAMVGSQEYVNCDGLEYEKILPALHADPSMNAEQLAVVSAQSAEGNHERSGAAIRLGSAFDTLVSAVDAWSLALMQALPSERAALTRAFAATQDFWQANEDKDLLDMVREINARVSDNMLKTRGTAVIEAYAQILLYEWSTNAYPDANGLTIYHIDKADEKTRYDGYHYNTYPTLTFAQATQWWQFVEAFAQ